MKRRSAALSSAMAVAILGVASPSFGGDPHAMHKPTDQAIWNYYPERAYRSGIQGQALISCAVDEQARLKSCILLDEQPRNQNFGDAALLLASRDLVNPPTGTPTQKDGYHMMLTFCADPPGIYPTYPPSGPKPPCVK
jgi:TonB family protein